MSKVKTATFSDQITGMIKILSVVNEFAKQLDEVVASRAVKEKQVEEIGEDDVGEEEKIDTTRVSEKLGKFKGFMKSMADSAITTLDESVKKEPNTEFGKKLLEASIKK